MRALFLGGVGAALALMAATGMAREALLLAMAFAVGEVGSLCAADAFYAACAAETDADALQGKRADALIGMCVGCLILYALNAALGDMPAYMVNCAAGYVIARMLFEMLRAEGARAAAGALGGAVVLALLLARFSPLGFYRTLTAALALSCLAVLPRSMIFQLRRPRMALLRATPNALRARAAYLAPGAAACILLCARGVNAAEAYCAGLAAFSLLSADARPAGPAAERFPARWAVGALIALACAALGRDGALSGAFCAWGAICALWIAPDAPSSGRSALCALLLAAQGCCGFLPLARHWRTLLGCAPLCLTILSQRGALYAAWLPLRARWIRRRTGGR